MKGMEEMIEFRIWWMKLLHMKCGPRTGHITCSYRAMSSSATCFHCSRMNIGIGIHRLLICSSTDDIIYETGGNNTTTVSFT